MSLIEAHQVMQTVIEGINKNEELGFDLAQQTFVLKNSLKHSSQVTYNAAEVSDRLKKFILERTIYSSDLEQFVHLVKSRQVSPLLSSKQPPLNMPLIEVCKVAEEQLRCQISAQFADKVITSQVVPDQLREELKNSRDFRIVLDHSPQGNSHTFYCYDPETKTLQASKKPFGAQSIRELAGYFSRKWQVQDVLTSTDPAAYPRLKLLRIKVATKLSMKDFTSQPPNTVFLQASPNILRFRLFHLFKKNGYDPGQVFCLFSKNLTDLPATIHVMDRLRQIFEAHKADFVASSQGFPMQAVEGSTKVLLELVKDSPIIRAHYFDLSEGKVKSHDFVITEKESVGSFTMEMARFKERLAIVHRANMDKIKEQYSQDLVNNVLLVPSYEQELRANKVKIKCNDIVDTANKKVGHELYFFNPLTQAIDCYDTRGFSPQAIQNGLEYIARLRKYSQEVMRIDLSGLIEVQPNADYSCFVLSFSLPKAPHLTYQLQSKSLDDFAETVATIREREMELVELQRTNTILRSLSPLSFLEVPEAPPGVNVLDLEALFKKIDWIDPESPWYQDPTKLRDDGKITTAEKYLGGIKQIAQKAALAKHGELHKVLANIVKLLKAEEDTALAARCLLDLAEAGLHCEGRNLGVCLMIYRALTRQAEAVSGKEAVYGVDMIHRWLDELKLDVLNEMVSEGNNSENSHELIFYLKTLTNRGIAIPDSLVQHYNDIFLSLGKKGKYSTEDEVEVGFMAKFNALRIIDSTVEKTQELMRQAPAKTGASMIDLLRSYAEAHLLDKYPTIQEQIKAVEERYAAAKKQIVDRTDLSQTEKAALLEEAAEKMAKQKGQLFDQIIDKQQFTVVDDTLSKYDLSRAGVKAILLNAGFLKKLVT